jgi:hypothetical protein
LNHGFLEGKFCKIRDDTETFPVGFPQVEFGTICQEPFGFTKISNEAFKTTQPATSVEMTQQFRSFSPENIPNLIQLPCHDQRDLLRFPVNKLKKS